MRLPRPLDVVPDRRQAVDDSLVLGTAAACMRARAAAVLTWARGDEADLFGAREDNSESHDAGAHVAECLRELASLTTHEPRTVRGATAMLNVALDVLVHRLLEPDTALGEGSVIDIVRNVRAALEKADPDTPLVVGSAEAAERD